MPTIPRPGAVPATPRGALLFAALALLSSSALAAQERDAAPPAASARADAPAAAADADAGGADTSQRRGRSRRAMPGTTVLALEGDRKIELRFDQPATDDPAYAAIQSPVDGEVVQFVKGRPLKLKTPVDLRFGDTVVEAYNHVPDYPGVYSLWLKSVGGQWRLVFNDYADVWGTQHDSAADAAEVPLTLAAAAQPVESFTAKLEPAPGGGILRLAWGTVEFSAPFVVE